MLPNNPETKLRDYSTIFTEPEENNNYCFSIIPQVIIREIAFSFILFVSSSKTSRNRVVANHLSNYTKGRCIHHMLKLNMGYTSCSCKMKKELLYIIMSG